MRSSGLSKRVRVGVAAIIVLAALGVVVVVWPGLPFVKWGHRPEAAQTPPTKPAAVRKPVQIATGKVRPALPYRIVSFHWGRADKELIALAAQLGFNGVQIQIEGSTVEGIRKFAQYDAAEHLVEYCHKLGMQVTVWVHELSDVPAPWMPEWLGTVTVDNAGVWSVLDGRYEWILHDAIPQVDGLVLTVVETQINATDTPVMLKLVGLLGEKCRKYGKSLTVRSFVWYPDELDSIMAAIKQMPPDTLIMSKCVPQDWQMRGAFASEIGNVGGRPQIVEYDACGEYFLRDSVANCMPELLKKHFDYGMQKKVSGICVRVDRENSSVLHQPSEVNLWTLGMLAAGATDDLEEIWTAWATNRFGPAAAPGVIRALKPTQEVIAEMLSVGPFTFGDTRYFPPLGDEDVFGDNWQNYWWDSSYEPIRKKAEAGDAQFTREVAAGKAHARQLADLCLLNLELVRGSLTSEDYAILKTKLMTNKAQLEWRAPMVMAVLHYRAMIEGKTAAEREAADKALQEDLAQLRAVARPIYPAPQEISYLGRTWKVGQPADIQREWIFSWAWKMDLLRRGEDPREPQRGQRAKGSILPNRYTTYRNFWPTGASKRR